MSPRSIQVSVVVLILAAGIPLAAVGQGAPEQQPDYPVHLVSDRPVLGVTLAIHEDRVVWASPAEGTVEIRLANLTSGEERVAAEIADPDGELRVPSIAYDGRWIVWTDDRFGQGEVFAADTENGTTTQLTRSEGPPSTIDASGGYAVWLQGTNLTLANLETEKMEVYREQARAPPQIVGPRVLWGHGHGTNVTLYVDNLEEQTVRELATVEDGGVSKAALASQRATWIAAHLDLDGREVKGVYNLTVDTVALGDGEDQESPVNVETAGRLGGVATSDDWVAWKYGVEGRPGLVKMMHMPTQGIVPFETLSTGGLVMSEEKLAFVGTDDATGNRTGGYVYALDLHPPDVTTSSSTAADRGIGFWVLVAGGIGLVAAWPISRVVRDR